MGNITETIRIANGHDASPDPPWIETPEGMVMKKEADQWTPREKKQLIELLRQACRINEVSPLDTEGVVPGDPPNDGLEEIPVPSLVALINLTRDFALEQGQAIKKQIAVEADIYQKKCADSRRRINCRDKLFHDGADQPQTTNLPFIIQKPIINNIPPYEVKKLRRKRELPAVRTTEIVQHIEKPVVNLPDLIRKRQETADYVVKADSNTIERTMDQWNRAFKTIDAHTILKNWDLFEPFFTLTEWGIKEQELTKIRDALTVIDAHKGIFEDQNVSLRQIMRNVRYVYAGVDEAGKVTFDGHLNKQASQNRFALSIRNPVFLEISKAVITVLDHLDLPSIIAKPVEEIIEGNTDAGQVSRAIQALEELKSPFVYHSPQVDIFVENILTDIKYSSSAGSNIYEFARDDATIQRFGDLIQEMVNIVTLPKTAWAGVTRNDAQDFLDYLASGIYRTDLVIELMNIMRVKDRIISPYQLQGYFERSTQGAYEMLDGDFNRHRFSDLGRHLLDHKYLISSAQREHEHDELLLSLKHRYDSKGLALDLGSAMPNILVNKARMLGHTGPRVSVDRAPLTVLTEDTIRFRHEFGATHNGHVKIIMEHAWDFTRRCQKPYRHLRVDLTDTDHLVKELDDMGFLISLLLEQASATLYLPKEDKLKLRETVLKRLGTQQADKIALAVFTGRYRVMENWLNEIVLKRDGNGKFSVCLKEARKSVGRDFISALISGQHYDQEVSPQRSDYENRNLLFETSQETLPISVSCWLDFLEKNHPDIYAKINSIPLPDHYQKFGINKYILDCICGSLSTTYLFYNNLPGDIRELRQEGLIELIYWGKVNKPAGELTPLAEAIKWICDNHPFIICGLRELILLNSQNPDVNLDRSIQGALFFNTVPIELRPDSSTAITRTFRPEAYLRATDRYSRTPHISVAEFEKSQEKYHPEKIEDRFAGFMEQKYFPFRAEKNVIYPKDEKEYNRSLGRSDIEQLLIEYLSKSQESKPLSESFPAYEVLRSGSQLCLRDNDARELAAELDKGMTPTRAACFEMLGYFILREKDQISLREVIYPLLDFFRQEKLDFSRIRAVVHPAENAVLKILAERGISPDNVTLSEKACNWRQGGTPNPQLGGNLTGRNFELFYIMPDGRRIELANFININGIEGREEKFGQLGVWEVACGKDRLEMALLSQKHKRNISVFDTSSFLEIHREINRLSNAGHPNHNRLTDLLTDRLTATRAIIHSMSMQNSDFDKILSIEEETLRFRAHGRKLIRETIILSRLLKIPQDNLVNIVLQRGLVYYNGLERKILTPSQENEERILAHELEEYDKSIIHLLQHPHGPLNLLLKDKTADTKITERTYRGTMENIGLSPFLYDEIMEACQRIVAAEKPDGVFIQNMLFDNLGIRLPEEILRKKAQEIALHIEQTRLNPDSKTWSVSLGKYAKPSRPVIKTLRQPILEPDDGQPAIDHQKAIDEAAERIAHDIAEYLPHLDDGNRCIIAMGNGPEADGTPHNMSVILMKTLIKALEKSGNVTIEKKSAKYLDTYLISFPNGGTLTVLINNCDVNYCGRAILQNSDLSSLPPAIVVWDNARLSLGRIEASSGIDEGSAHNGLRNIAELLGSFPCIGIGTHTDNQTGSMATNLLRKYSGRDQDAVTEALITYCAAVITSIGKNTGRSKKNNPKSAQ